VIDAWFCKINFNFIYPTQLKFERSSLKLKTITEIEVMNNGKEIDTCEGSHRAFEAHATSTNARISPSLMNLEVSRWGFVSESTHVDVGSTCISIFISLSFPPLILYANSLQNSNVSCFFIFMSNLVLIFFIVICFVFNLFFNWIFFLQFHSWTS